MLHHFISVCLLSRFLSSSFPTTWSISIIGSSFVISICTISIDLKPKRLFRELGALKYVAEFSWANHATLTVPILKFLIPIMATLHVELKVILGLKRLLTNMALVVLFEKSLVSKLLQVFLHGTEIVERALLSILYHWDSISAEYRHHFWVDAVDNVLGMHERAIIIFKVLFLSWSG